MGSIPSRRRTLPVHTRDHASTRCRGCGADHGPLEHVQSHPGEATRATVRADDRVDLLDDSGHVLAVGLCAWALACVLEAGGDQDFAEVLLLAGEL